MNIYYASGDDSACGYYRTIVPAEAINGLEGHSAMSVFKSKLSAIPREIDVVILQRQINPQLREVIRMLQSRGIIVGYELDDNLWQSHPDNKMATWWTPDKLAGASFLIGQCDFAVTTNEAMANLLKKFNPDVLIAPNYIRRPSKNTKAKEHKNKKLRIGWSGSPSHRIDFKNMPFLRNVLLDIKELYDVDLVFYGYVPENMEAYVEHCKFSSMSMYMNNLVTLDFDIGIIPCYNHVFNHFKSDLKFLEYSICHVPSVASSITPYQRTVTPDTGILVADTYEDWFRGLSILITNETERKRLAGNAYDYTVKHGVINSGHASELVEAFQMIYRAKSSKAIQVVTR